MSTNYDTKEYLDYYLSLGLETDFAVMLNGPWGAGKTYFIKGYLKERCDEAVSTDSRQPLDYLYASLYGVRSVSEITDQFFAQAHPIMNSKAARLLGSVVSHAFNGYVGTDVNSSTENKSIIQEMVLKLEGRVLIFDDLERCAMRLSEVMGFINAYVEHEGLKVIVIASEDDIPEEQKKDYIRKKEKLVGKTLRVTSEPELVLHSLVTKLTNQAVIDTINRETGPLLRTFNASKRQNFRSLRSVLSDFERLVTASDPRLQKAPQAMAKLLLFMMATEMEHRSGDLTSQEIESLPETMRWKTIYRVTRKEKTPAVLKAEQLEAKYPDVEWRDAIVPPTALAILFETGIIDTVSINKHLAKHPLVVGYAETPAWRQLWSWVDLPREQYLKAREKLVAELQGRELTHPGIILHAAGIVISLKAFDDYLVGDENVVTFFERYIEDIRTAGRLEPARDLFGPTGGAYASLGYASADSPELREICATVKVATDASFADQMREVALTYLDRISKNPDAYSSLHEFGTKDRNYGDAPFLHYIDPDHFARLLIKDSSPDGRLFANLVARYRFESHHRALADEYPWLKTLRSRLESIAATAQPPHKHLLDMRIKDYFDNIDKSVGEADVSATASDENAGVIKES